MADVLNRTTLQFLASVNTPDFPVGSWVIDPDMSAVANVPQKYWLLTGDVVSEMDQAAKDVVNAAAAAAQKAAAAGAAMVREYATTGDLPQPPPRANLVVSLTDSGSAIPGMAISTGAGWMVFPSTRVIT